MFVRVFVGGYVRLSTYVQGWHVLTVVLISFNKQKGLRVPCLAKQTPLPLYPIVGHCGSFLNTNSGKCY